MTNGLSQNTLILDTNILIDLALWLPFEINRPFWIALEKGLDSTKWILLDVVDQEIRGHRGLQLRQWCDLQKKIGLVTPITQKNRERALEINNQYKMIDDVSGKSSADPYILAFAEEEKITLLSREGKRKPNETLYKMEDVCEFLHIKYTRSPNDLYQAINYSN